MPRVSLSICTVSQAKGLDKEKMGREAGTVVRLPGVDAAEWRHAGFDRKSSDGVAGARAGQ